MKNVPFENKEVTNLVLKENKISFMGDFFKDTEKF